MCLQTDRLLLSSHVNSASDGARLQLYIDCCFLRLLNGDRAIFNLREPIFFNEYCISSRFYSTDAIEALIIGGRLSRYVGLGVGDLHLCPRNYGSILIPHGTRNRTTR